MWSTRNEIVRDGAEEYEQSVKDIKAHRFVKGVLAKNANKHVGVGKKKKPSVAQKRLDKANSKAYTAFLKERNLKLTELRKRYKNDLKQGSLANAVSVDAHKMAKHIPNMTTAQVKDMQGETVVLLAQYNVPLNKMCNAYASVVTQVDNSPESEEPFLWPNFLENPNIAIRDEVRLLGKGDLIKVEETFIGYRPGEISYIENILAGEVRKREVKSTKYFEQVRESIEEETTDITEETSSKSKQDLESEIESELNTRFNSDINASASGSGGGTIGVVDFSGSGSINAGLGIGVDTSLSTSNVSKFSQEIVNKAVEKTKKHAVERRLNRSYSLYETTNLHEIDNKEGDSKNGIYCFLDKEVCIKETTYGKRMFLMANIATPGKNLLREQSTKIRLNLLEQGQKPVFNITPEDIHPHNYKELVGRFNASNVQPPPPPIQTIARTYKTDTTNKNVEQKEMNMKAVADILVPFFERYKRFLLMDTIKLPDGYQAQEVSVTVNHGSNGLSIPAHLPLSVAGAAIYTTPTMMASVPYLGLTLPYAFWQIAYLASPMLHYNADSSNVTVSVGNESRDSPYYFFQPDILIREIFDFVGNFSALTPDFLDTIKSMADSMVASLGEHAGEMTSEVFDLIKTVVEDIVANITAVFDQTIVTFNPANALNFGDNSIKLVKKIGKLAPSLDEDALELIGETFFAPLQSFLDDAFEIVSEELISSLGEIFEYFTSMFENSQQIPFSSVAGMRGEIPVTFNTVSINPGVTINLTVCATRTDELLDQWRLDTFSSLYQSYLQQMAEYENKIFISPQSGKITSSPGTMRKAEMVATKELVLHALNNYTDAEGNNYTLERINFFENAIDWNNMSYKLYNYGPNKKEILLDKFGAYSHIDDRRKVFLKAHWAQVIIPVHENEYLEGQVSQYFDNGSFNFEGGFSQDELAALYQDIVLGREMLDEQNEPETRREIIPTDFVILQEELPENEDHPCP